VASARDGPVALEKISSRTPPALELIRIFRVLVGRAKPRTFSVIRFSPIWGASSSFGGG